MSPQPELEIARYCPNCDGRVALERNEAGDVVAAKCDHCSIEWQCAGAERHLSTEPMGEAERERQFARALERSNGAA